MARTQQVQHTAGNAIRQKVDAQKAAKRAKRAAAIAAAAAAEAEAEAQRAEAEAEAEDDDENYEDDEESSEEEEEEESGEEESGDEESDEEEEAPKPSKKSGAHVKKSAVQTKAHASKTSKTSNAKTRVKQPPASASSTRASAKKAKKEPAPAPAKRVRTLKKPPQMEVFTKTRADGTEVKMKRITTFLPNGETSVVEKRFRRFHPGTVALRRIREFQRPRSKPYIKRLPLKRVFLEKVQDHYCSTDECYRIQRRAMLLCQEAVESFLIQLVRDSLGVIARMTKKQTLTADSIYTTALLKHAPLIPNITEYKSQNLSPRSHFATVS